MEPEPTYSAYGFTPEEFPAIHTFQKEARARAKQALAEQKAKVEGVGDVETLLLEGNPLSALLEYAEAAEEGLPGIQYEGSELVIVGDVASLIRIVGPFRD